MKTPQTVRCLLLIAALALIPVLPYAILGYAGQDLPFHVCSWLDLRDGWLAGHLTPGWSAAANFGLGDPHLTFYPPFSYILGALLTLFLPLKLAPAVFVWIALFVSGSTMYAACRRFVAERDRLMAAVLYMLGPYMVTTSLIRFAAAELMVQAWLPLIALHFYETVVREKSEEPWRSKTRNLILLALLLGLSWITNVPASIVLLYSLGGTALLCAYQQRSAVPMYRVIAAETLAAALAAFHLAPVWRERQWIHPDTLLRINPLQLLLFMPHYTFDDSPLLVVCWIFLCVETALAVACLRRRSLRVAHDAGVLTWATLVAVSFFLQSPLAGPLWQHAPELRFVQFPLRFLSITGVAIPMLLLSRGTRKSLRRLGYVLLATLSTMPFVAYLSEQAVAINRTPPLSSLLASWQQKGAPEYLPAGTLMPIGPADLPDVSALNALSTAATDKACPVEIEQQSQNLRVLHTAATAPCQVRLKLYFYPYWTARDELFRPQRVSRDSTGLLLLDVPAGPHTLSLEFYPASGTRTASRMLSLSAFILAMWVLWSARSRSKDTRGQEVSSSPRKTEFSSDFQTGSEP